MKEIITKVTDTIFRMMCTLWRRMHSSFLYAFLTPQSNSLIVPGGHKYSFQLSCVLNWKCSYSERLDRALDLNRLSVYVFKVTKRVHVQLSALLDLIPIPLFRSDHGWHTSSHRQCQVIAHQLIYISTVNVTLLCVYFICRYCIFKKWVLCHTCGASNAIMKNNDENSSQR